MRKPVPAQKEAAGGPSAWSQPFNSPPERPRRWDDAGPPEADQKAGYAENSVSVRGSGRDSDSGRGSDRNSISSSDSNQNRNRSRLRVGGTGAPLGRASIKSQARFARRRGCESVGNPEGFPRSVGRRRSRLSIGRQSHSLAGHAAAIRSCSRRARCDAIRVSLSYRASVVISL